MIAAEAWGNSHFRIDTSRHGNGGWRALPLVFMEQGVAMFSSADHSPV